MTGCVLILLFALSIQGGPVTWDTVKREEDKMLYVGTKEDNGHFHHHFKAQEDAKKTEEMFSEHTKERRSSAQMFGGINKMLEEIKEEHKLNGETFHQTNIRKSLKLQNEIRNLKQKSSPILITEQLKYIPDTELLVSQQGNGMSLYVNITKDTPDHDEVDTDGHKVHIHIPHKVLLEMTTAGDDHVIHIDIPQTNTCVNKLEDLETEKV